jgi:DNA mismatch repair protein MutS
MKTQRDICEAAYREWLRFNTQHPDTLYFIRLGDFYETFDGDAETAAQRFGLTVTRREPPSPLALTGLPYTHANEYLRHLVQNGHKVRVNEKLQMELIAV